MENWTKALRLISNVISGEDSPENVSSQMKVLEAAFGGSLLTLRELLKDPEKLKDTDPARAMELAIDALVNDLKKGGDPGTFADEATADAYLQALEDLKREIREEARRQDKSKPSTGESKFANPTPPPLTGMSETEELQWALISYYEALIKKGFVSPEGIRQARQWIENDENLSDKTRQSMMQRMDKFIN